MRLQLWVGLTLALLGQNQITFVVGKPQPGADEQGKRDVHVAVSIRGEKTTFRAGEPIRLVMSFTADQPGYSVDQVGYGPPVNPADVLIDPGPGVSQWADAYARFDPPYRDFSSPRGLSSHPIEIPIALNWWIRFDDAGEYTVRTSTLISSLQTANLRVVSNPVTFRVVPMSEQEETDEVTRLQMLMRAPSSQLPSTAEAACEDLLFLTGHAATRTKVDLFLHPPQGLTRCASYARWGLYISRDSRFVVPMLEQALKDGELPIPSWDITRIASYRTWSDMASLAATASGDTAVLERLKRERLDAVTGTYVNDIAERLQDLPADIRRRTAVELIKGRTTMPPAVREVLVEQFASLSAREQLWLSIMRWQELNAPELVLPVLRQTVARPAKSAMDPDREQALSRLLEISPAEGQSRLVTEILDRTSFIAAQSFRLPKPCALPDIDRPLVALLAELAASRDAEAARPAEVKAMWLARCGTAAVRADVRRLYDDERLGIGTRAYLLGYLGRLDDAEAAPLLTRAVANGGAKDIYWRIAMFSYSRTLDGLLHFDLESDDAATASRAATLLAQYGAPDTRQVLEARLARWLKDWSRRPLDLEASDRSDADGESQGSLQGMLILCITRARAWKVSDAEAFALRKTCVTPRCRQIVGDR